MFGKLFDVGRVHAEARVEPIREVPHELRHDLTVPIAVGCVVQRVQQDLHGSPASLLNKLVRVLAPKVHPAIGEVGVLRKQCRIVGVDIAREQRVLPVYRGVVQAHRVNLSPDVTDAKIPAS